MTIKNFAIIGLVILVASILIAVKDLSIVTFYEKDLNSEQHEIVLESSGNKTHVLNKNGKLSHVGWSKSYKNFHFCSSRINPSTSYLTILNKIRYKKWEAFVFVHKDFIIGTGVFDFSYLGGYMIHYANLRDKGKDPFFRQYMNPMKYPSMPDECHTNCESAKWSLPEFNYHQTKDIGKFDNQYLNMTFHYKDDEIILDLVLRGQDLDSIVTLTPMSNDTTLFYYNIKTYNILARGTIKINGISYNADEVMVAYDSGRGVWPIRSGWVWVSGNGKTKDGNLFGLNIGHGFSNPDASRHTEDSFFVNGKLFKLAAVDSKMVKTDDPNEMFQWRFNSESTEQIKNKCSLIFTPLKKKENFTFNFGFTKNTFNVNYGIFHGDCQDENGNIHTLDKVYGIIEQKMAAW